MIKNKPSPIILFFIKVVGVYAVWYFIYDVILLSDGRLDNWLSLISVKISSNVLTAFGWQIETTRNIIQCVGTNGVQIQNGCNGLQLYGLFSGFIIAYPGEFVKRLWFLIGGISLLLIANIVRISYFVLANKYFPESWNIVHDTSSLIFFYPIVLTLWYLWTIQNKQANIFSGEE
jgi:exosortase/archaeosortase family protein